MKYEKLSANRLSWPTDWQQIFKDVPGSSPRPLILEIGFGRAVFLAHLARTNPQAGVIGVEVSSRCMVEGEHLIVQYGLLNARVVHSTAETALHHLFAPATLAQIHINFPDPWFKTGHAHRRLMQRDTLDAMVSRLQPDGKLYLATDIVEYAEMSADLLRETAGLTNLLSTPYVYTMPGRVITKYEAKAAREGRRCYYFAYTRNDAAALDLPVQKDLPMPHLVFQSPLSLGDIHGQFDTMQQQHEQDGVYISFLRAYRGAHDLLIETYIKEPTIEQHLALILMQRKLDNEFTLKLSTIGQPRPTAGVHRAVALLGAWLLGLHSDSRVIQDKIAAVEE
jgi:tRNA (guanine-N7-)-methyltransferase